MAELAEIDRRDGRTEREMRACEVSRGLLHRADGSARWEAGGTRVLAAVHGPRWSHGPHSPDGLVLDLVINGGVCSQSDESTLKAALLGSVEPLDHPRSNALVALLVEYSDGSELACACNAAIAAIVDAGISCPRPLTAASLALFSPGLHVLDPTHEEEANARASACVTGAFVTLHGRGEPIITHVSKTSAYPCSHS